MKVNTKIVLLAIVFSLYTFGFSFSQLTKNSPIHSQILNTFEGNSKAMFKAYHFIFNKSYELDSYIAIQKYKVFKANVEKIKQINKSGKKWVAGINHLTDMTSEEFKKHYNLKPMKIKELRNNIRNLFNFDDYNDDEEEKKPNIKVSSKVRGLDSVDHRKHDLKVRDQGECGSCWAFTTASMLEGQWGVQKGSKLDDYISTQQMVDCDKSNNGCDGGWYEGALNYLIKNGYMKEKDYKYKGVQGKCKFNKKKVVAKVKSFREYAREDENSKREQFEEMIMKGPLAVAVDANDDFQMYESGIWNGACGQELTHAVTLVGWQKSNTDGEPHHWIIRNSWSERWGENGYMRVADNDNNNYSCGIETFAYDGTWA